MLNGSVSCIGSLGLLLAYIIHRCVSISAMVLFVPTCQLINVTRHVSLYEPSADEIHKKTASPSPVYLDH